MKDPIAELDRMLGEGEEPEADSSPDPISLLDKMAGAEDDEEAQRVFEIHKLTKEVVKPLSESPEEPAFPTLPDLSLNSDRVSPPSDQPPIPSPTPAPLPQKTPSSFQGNPAPQPQAPPSNLKAFPSTVPMKKDGSADLLAPPDPAAALGKVLATDQALSVPEPDTMPQYLVKQFPSAKKPLDFAAGVAQNIPFVGKAASDYLDPNPAETSFQQKAGGFAGGVGRFIGETMIGGQLLKVPKVAAVAKTAIEKLAPLVGEAAAAGMVQNAIAASVPSASRAGSTAIDESMAGTSIDESMIAGAVAGLSTLLMMTTMGAFKAIPVGLDSMVGGAAVGGAAEVGEKLATNVLAPDSATAKQKLEPTNVALNAALGLGMDSAEGFRGGIKGKPSFGRKNVETRMENNRLPSRLDAEAKNLEAMPKAKQPEPAPIRKSRPYTEVDQQPEGIIKGEDGIAVRAFHGTNKDFEDYSIPKDIPGPFAEGIHFADNPDIASSYAKGDGANVRPVNLIIKKPYVIGHNLPGDINIKNLKEQGYDGIVGGVPGKGATYVVFSKEQVIPAFGRSSDKADPDIVIPPENGEAFDLPAPDRTVAEETPVISQVKPEEVPPEVSKPTLEMPDEAFPAKIQGETKKPMVPNQPMDLPKEKIGLETNLEPGKEMGPPKPNIKSYEGFRSMLREKVGEPEREKATKNTGSEAFREYEIDEGLNPEDTYPANTDPGEAEVDPGFEYSKERTFVELPDKGEIEINAALDSEVAEDARGILREWGLADGDVLEDGRNTPGESVAEKMFNDAIEEAKAKGADPEAQYAFAKGKVQRVRERLDPFVKVLEAEISNGKNAKHQTEYLASLAHHLGFATGKSGYPSLSTKALVKRKSAGDQLARDMKKGFEKDVESGALSPDEIISRGKEVKDFSKQQAADRGKKEPQLGTTIVDPESGFGGNLNASTRVTVDPSIDIEKKMDEASPANPEDKGASYKRFKAAVSAIKEGNKAFQWQDMDNGESKALVGPLLRAWITMQSVIAASKLGKPLSKLVHADMAPKVGPDRNVSVDISQMMADAKNIASEATNLKYVQSGHNSWKEMYGDILDATTPAEDATIWLNKFNEVTGRLNDEFRKQEYYGEQGQEFVDDNNLNKARKNDEFKKQIYSREIDKINEELRSLIQKAEPNSLKHDVKFNAPFDLTNKETGETFENPELSTGNAKRQFEGNTGEKYLPGFVSPDKKVDAGKTAKETIENAFKLEESEGNVPVHSNPGKGEVTFGEVLGKIPEKESVPIYEVMKKAFSTDYFKEAAKKIRKKMESTRWAGEEKIGSDAREEVLSWAELALEEARGGETFDPDSKADEALRNAIAGGILEGNPDISLSNITVRLNRAKNPVMSMDVPDRQNFVRSNVDSLNSYFSSATKKGQFNGENLDDAGARVRRVEVDENGNVFAFNDNGIVYDSERGPIVRRMDKDLGKDVVDFFRSLKPDKEIIDTLNAAGQMVGDRIYRFTAKSEDGRMVINFDYVDKGSKVDSYVKSSGLPHVFKIASIIDKSPNRKPGSKKVTDIALEVARDIHENPEVMEKLLRDLMNSTKPGEPKVQMPDEISDTMKARLNRFYDAIVENYDHLMNTISGGKAAGGSFIGQRNARSGAVVLDMFRRIIEKAINGARIFKNMTRSALGASGKEDVSARLKDEDIGSAFGGVLTNLKSTASDGSKKIIKLKSMVDEKIKGYNGDKQELFDVFEQIRMNEAKKLDGKAGKPLTGSPEAIAAAQDLYDALWNDMETLYSGSNSEAVKNKYFSSGAAAKAKALPFGPSVRHKDATGNEGEGMRPAYSDQSRPKSYIYGEDNMVRESPKANPIHELLGSVAHDMISAERAPMIRKLISYAKKDSNGKTLFEKIDKKDADKGRENTIRIVEPDGSETFYRVDEVVARVMDSQMGNAEKADKLELLHRFSNLIAVDATNNIPFVWKNIPEDMITRKIGGGSSGIFDFSRAEGKAFAEKYKGKERFNPDSSKERNKALNAYEKALFTLSIGSPKALEWLYTRALANTYQAEYDAAVARGISPEMAADIASYKSVMKNGSLGDRPVFFKNKKANDRALSVQKCFAFLNTMARLNYIGAKSLSPSRRRLAANAFGYVGLAASTYLKWLSLEEGRNQGYTQMGDFPIGIPGITPIGNFLGEMLHEKKVTPEMMWKFASAFTGLEMSANAFSFVKNVAEAASGVRGQDKDKVYREAAEREPGISAISEMMGTEPYATARVLPKAIRPYADLAATGGDVGKTLSAMGGRIMQKFEPRTGTRTYFADGTERILSDTESKRLTGYGKKARTSLLKALGEAKRGEATPGDVKRYTEDLERLESEGNLYYDSGAMSPDDVFDDGKKRRRSRRAPRRPSLFSRRENDDEDDD